ncbi:flagellar basal body rod protein FlgB [Pseudohalioglobus lutimaris]|uniref:Flagellar basal body rod protein FlgB n=1 Tax=Pseudohalioglobus lutimaris TaxID=1737061 RepID=A0A2N5X1P9_9GAMM|nr:flagellar basal body rod protein FlgB [Pseudohalioglobus lutimaris]PLW68413.1 flagellar basal body rod protein FlgB [Pseudohalioglobus lutimaris]
MQMIDRVFGVSPQALTLRSQRFEMLSANLANADTPGYKAVDMDFRAAMTQAQQQMVRPQAQAHPAHIPLAGESSPGKLYRVPVQRSLDGNTVETEQEHAAFMDNAIRYQASLNFLDERISSIKRTLRGE